MKLTSKIAATLAVLALVSTAHAAKINGEIGFTGNFVQSATNITFSNVTVLGAAGDYSGTIGQTFVGAGENFGALSIAPMTQVQNLWTFIVGPTTYSFQTSSVAASGTGKWSGGGMAKITGFEDTPGIWEVTNNIGFTFSAGTKTVPDGGATLAFLGLSFLGLGGVSRFVRRK